MTEPRPGVEPATSTADLMLTASEEHTQHWEQRALAAEAEVDRLHADLADAQQRITGVRAIHSPSRPTWNQPVDWCAGCGHDYPCPTIAALSAAGTDQTGGDEQ